MVNLSIICNKKNIYNNIKSKIKKYNNNLSINNNNMSGVKYKLGGLSHLPFYFFCLSTAACKSITGLSPFLHIWLSFSEILIFLDMKFNQNKKQTKRIKYSMPQFNKKKQEIYFTFKHFLHTDITCQLHHVMSLWLRECRIFYNIILCL